MVSGEWVDIWGNVFLWSLSSDLSNHFPMVLKYDSFKSPSTNLKLSLEAFVPDKQEKSCAPPKVVVFYWRIFLNRLSSWVNLF